MTEAEHTSTAVPRADAVEESAVWLELNGSRAVFVRDPDRSVIELTGKP